LITIVALGFAAALKKTEPKLIYYYKQSSNTEINLDTPQSKEKSHWTQLNSGELLSKEKVQWIETTSDKLNFGQTSDVIWLKLDNSFFKDGLNIIDIPFRQLDMVEAYTILKSSGEVIIKQVSGDRLKYDEKTFSTERVIFSIYKDEPIEVLIRSHTTGVNQIPLRIYGISEFIESHDFIGLLIAFFIGFSLITVIMDLIWFSMYKLQSYIYYAIAILGLMVLISFHYRVINILIPNIPIDTQHSMVLFGMMFAFFGGSQCMRYLFMEWGENRYDVYLNKLPKITLMTFCVSFLVEYETALPILYIYILLSSIILVVVPIHFIYTNRQSVYTSSAITFVNSWLFFFLGAGVQILMEFGVLNEEYFVNNALLIGSVGIVLCSLVILSNNIEIDKHQKILTEKELNSAKEFAYRADKMNLLQGMSASLVHDIKNPLNWMASDVEFLEELGNNKSDDELIELSKTIGDGINKIDEIITDLNWFAEPSKSALDTRVNLRSVIEKTLRIAKTEIGDVKLEIAVPEHIEIYGREGRIAQILMNILTNSIKAISSKTSLSIGLIEVTVKEVGIKHTGQKDVVIEWKDNGIGVAKNELDKLTESFYRGGSYEKGMGLGMFVVKSIIDKHGGSIRFESVQNEWTKVIITFPNSPLSSSEQNIL